MLNIFCVVIEGLKDNHTYCPLGYPDTNKCFQERRVNIKFCVPKDADEAFEEDGVSSETMARE